MLLPVKILLNLVYCVLCLSLFLNELHSIYTVYIGMSVMLSRCSAPHIMLPSSSYRNINQGWYVKQWWQERSGTALSYLRLLCMWPSHVDWNVPTMYWHQHFHSSACCVRNWEKSIVCGWFLKKWKQGMCGGRGLMMSSACFYSFYVDLW